MIHIAICGNDAAGTKWLKAKVTRYLLSRGLEHSIVECTDGIPQGVRFDTVFCDSHAQARMSIENEFCGNVILIGPGDIPGEAGHLEHPISTTKLRTLLDEMEKRSRITGDGYVYLHKAWQVKKLRIEDIMYCEVDGNCITLYTTNGMDSHIGSIDDFLKELTGDFFRCHRKYAINLKYVIGCENDTVHMTCGTKLPLAVRRRAEFEKRYTLYSEVKH